MASSKARGRKAARKPTVPTLAFFFGAGAEVSYGMPVGGRFALEVLRAKNPLDEFKRQRDRVSSSGSAPYRKWLPENFATSRVYGLGKGERSRVFDDSLRGGFPNVITSLNNYDATAARFLRGANVTERHAIDVFAILSGGHKLGETPYETVAFNRSIAETPASLFRSKYFSAMALLAKVGSAQSAMTKLARATIQFYLGAHGQSAIQAMTVNPLVNIPDDNPAFAELGQMFDLNPVEAGIAAFEAVMEYEYDTGSLSDETLFAHLATYVLERTVEQFLDYRTIIDELLPALYRPKDSWAKFTKIISFLIATRNYVLAQQDAALAQTNGYYHDLARAIEKGRVDVSSVGTSNYTNLCSEALRGIYNGSILALNGSLDQYLDPYKNELIDQADVEHTDRFLAPFLFTQSGVKPLTSVEVSRRYVEYYEKVTSSDAAVIVGFGFNGDDGHINALFRQAVDQHDTTLIVLQYDGDNSLDADQSRAEIAERLRIDKFKNIKVLLVDGDRRVNGVSWIDAIAASSTRK